ncbi:hypothetical protein ZOSMA_7G00520 [Zostera marina]|uniref:Uncharacterized protein n=1 Tax=Zostera marina TaxID=29655 RepID=A0A0K9NN32_ZOSMR|nr:hypothetical protein ZOSMA_7G00520 [Zostera marina]
MSVMGNSCIFKSRHTLLSFPRRPDTLVSTLASERKMRIRFVVKGCREEKNQTSKKKSFLTVEEAGLVEMSGLSTHERFLCRLTISSLNLLRIVAEQEGLPIEELNAGSVCDWFVKDKLKREQNIDTAVLQWDDSDFQM